MNIPKAIFCWSGGKDSAYCLHKVISEGLYDVRYLLTTVNENFKRVSMHGVREELVEKQANAVGIELLKVGVTGGSNAEYEQKMERVLLRAKSEGIKHVVFGDIFLEDLRLYREKNLEKVGMKAVFPLWKMDTRELLLDFIGKGFKTITCCINDGYLRQEDAGVLIDRSFLDSLPSTVDPCGENGEYHSFCFEGPLFKEKIAFATGEKVYREGFWFCDLIPVEGTSTA